MGTKAIVSWKVRQEMPTGTNPGNESGHHWAQGPSRPRRQGRGRSAWPLRWEWVEPL